MSGKLETMTPELKAFVGEWKDKPGNLIMVLHKVQQTYGYIPREIAIEISEMLDVPLAKIYGVVTFYNFFKLQKAGKYIIQVCLGTACYVKGSQSVLDKLSEVLEIPVGGTTPDGRFTLEATRCLGACGLAPVMMINGEVYGRLTPDAVPAIIEKYKNMPGDAA